jgi:small subunit ribosomal protein S12e
LYVLSGFGGVRLRLISEIGQIDREGNPRKVVNCSCVVVKDWGEESQERSILLNYFQTEQ